MKKTGLIKKLMCVLLSVFMITSLIPTNAKAAAKVYPIDTFDNVIFKRVNIDGYKETLGEKLVCYTDGFEGSDTNTIYWNVDAANYKEEFVYTDNKDIGRKGISWIKKLPRSGFEEIWQFEIVLDQEGSFRAVNESISSDRMNFDGFYQIYRTVNNEGKFTYNSSQYSQIKDGKILVPSEYLNGLGVLLYGKNCLATVYAMNGEEKFATVHLSIDSLLNGQTCKLYKKQYTKYILVNNNDYSINQDKSLEIATLFQKGEDYYLLSDDDAKNSARLVDGKFTPSGVDVSKSDDGYGNKIIDKCMLDERTFSGARSDISEQTIENADGTKDKIYLIRYHKEGEYFDAIQITQSGDSYEALLLREDMSDGDKTNTVFLNISADGRLVKATEEEGFGERNVDGAIFKYTFIYPDGKCDEDLFIETENLKQIDAKQLDYAISIMKDEKSYISILDYNAEGYLNYQIVSNTSQLKGRKKLALLSFTQDEKMILSGRPKYRRDKDGNFPLTLKATKGQMYFFADNAVKDIDAKQYKKGYADFVLKSEGREGVTYFENIGNFSCDCGKNINISRYSTYREGLDKGLFSNSYIYQDQIEDKERTIAFYDYHEEKTACLLYGENYATDLGKNFRYVDSIIVNRDDLSFKSMNVSFYSIFGDNESVYGARSVNKDGNESVFIAEIELNRKKKNEIFIDYDIISELKYNFGGEGRDVSIYDAANRSAFVVKVNLDKLVAGEKLKMYQKKGDKLVLVTDVVYRTDADGNFKFKVSASKGQEYYLLTDAEVKEIKRNPQEAWAKRDQPLRKLYTNRDYEITHTYTNPAFVREYLKEYFIKDYSNGEHLLFEESDIPSFGQHRYCFEWGSENDFGKLASIIGEGYANVFYQKNTDQYSLSDGVVGIYFEDIRLVLDDDKALSKVAIDKIYSFDNATINVTNVLFDEKGSGHCLNDAIKYFDLTSEEGKNTISIDKKVLEIAALEVDGNAGINIINSNNGIRCLTTVDTLKEGKNLRLVKKVKGLYYLASYDLYSFNETGVINITIPSSQEKAEYFLVTQELAEKLLKTSNR